MEDFEFLIGPVSIVDQWLSLSSAQLQDIFKSELVEPFTSDISLNLLQLMRILLLIQHLSIAFTICCGKELSASVELRIYIYNFEAVFNGILNRRILP